MIVVFSSAVSMSSAFSTIEFFINPPGDEKNIFSTFSRSFTMTHLACHENKRDCSSARWDIFGYFQIERSFQAFRAWRLSQTSPPVENIRKKSMWRFSSRWLTHFYVDSSSVCLSMCTFRRTKPSSDFFYFSSVYQKTRKWFRYQKQQPPEVWHRNLYLSSNNTSEKSLPDSLSSGSAESQVSIYISVA